MRKTMTVATVVAALAAGVGVVTHNLIRTSGQFGRIGAEIPEPREEVAPVHEPLASQPREVTVAAPTAHVAESASAPRADELTPDERSPFGHDGGEQLQSDHETTIAEGPPKEDEADARSLAPLLSDARATLRQLLADADGDPDARAEVAALLGSATPFDALLEDPDPAVREEAAKLVEVLRGSTPQ